MPKVPPTAISQIPRMENIKSGVKDMVTNRCLTNYMQCNVLFCSEALWTRPYFSDDKEPLADIAGLRGASRDSGILAEHHGVNVWHDK